MLFSLTPSKVVIIDTVKIGLDTAAIMKTCVLSNDKAFYFPPLVAELLCMTS